MAIRLTSYLTVRNRIRDAYGVNEGEINTDVANRINTFINKRVRMAWEHYPWPELLVYEKRQMRETYASASTYTAGEQVLYTYDMKYYQALKAVGTTEEPSPAGVDNYAYWYPLKASYGDATNYDSSTAYVAGDVVYYYPTDAYYACHTASTGDLPTDTSYWGVLTPFERSISYTQSWESNTLGDVFRIWTKNPKVHNDALRIGWKPQGDAIIVADKDEDGKTTEAQVWVEYRENFDELTGDAYDNATAYVVGDKVYYSTTGNYYVNIQAGTGNLPTDTAYWTLIKLPYIFGEYAVQAAFADLIGKPDGQTEKQPIENSQGYELLLQQLDIINRQQGQEEPTEFKVY